MALGLIVAVAIIFSQSYTLHSKAAKVASTEQGEKQTQEQNNQEQTTILSVTNLPSAPSISLTQEAFCLFEISFFQPVSQDHDDQVYSTLGKFFSRIFSVLISPNAP